MYFCLCTTFIDGFVHWIRGVLLFVRSREGLHTQLKPYCDGYRYCLRCRVFTTTTRIDFSLFLFA